MVLPAENRPSLYFTDRLKLKQKKKSFVPWIWAQVPIYIWVFTSQRAVHSTYLKTENETYALPAMSHLIIYFNATARQQIFERKRETLNRHVTKTTAVVTDSVTSSGRHKIFIDRTLLSQWAGSLQGCKRYFDFSHTQGWKKHCTQYTASCRTQLNRASHSR